jgi:hypothetical protein
MYIHFVTHGTLLIQFSRPPSLGPLCCRMIALINTYHLHRLAPSRLTVVGAQLPLHHTVGESATPSQVLQTRRITRQLTHRHCDRTPDVCHGLDSTRHQVFTGPARPTQPACAPPDKKVVQSEGPWTHLAAVSGQHPQHLSRISRHLASTRCLPRKKRLTQN